MLRFAANLSLLFPELPFMERFAAARSAGFTGVEYLFPYEWPAARLRECLREQGLTQVLFNLPPGDWAGGERGIACLPDRVDEFREGVALARHYAAALDCRQLNCLAGLRPEGVEEPLLRDTLVGNVRWAAAELAKDGIRLCVEAINSKVDMPGFVMDTSERVMELIRAADADNLFLQYDVYHMQIMEGDLIRTLERLLPRIGHIQIADNPGRHEPGSGEIHYPAIFAALKRLGYTGWISAEYRPQTTTMEGLGWLTEQTGVRR